MSLVLVFGKVAIYGPKGPDRITVRIQGAEPSLASACGATREEALGNLILKCPGCFFLGNTLARMVLDDLKGYAVEILPDNPLLANVPCHDGEYILVPHSEEPWCLVRGEKV